MSTKAIQALYETRLLTWAAERDPVPRVAVPNVQFRRSQAAHLRCYVLPANTTTLNIGNTDEVFAGLFQITVVTPAGKGEGAARSIVAELQALFPINLDLTHGSLSVRVRTPLRERAGFPVDGFYELVTDFAYRSFA